MPRRCELLGTRSRSGQNVSHSNRKTKRRFDPNLQHASLFSDALRPVTKNGGLDSYLLSVDDAKLAPEGLRLKRSIRRALRGRAAS